MDSFFGRGRSKTNKSDAQPRSLASSSSAQSAAPSPDSPAPLLAVPFVIGQPLPLAGPSGGPRSKWANELGDGRELGRAAVAAAKVADPAPQQDVLAVLPPQPQVADPAPEQGVVLSLADMPGPRVISGTPLRFVWEYEGDEPGTWSDMGKAFSDIHNSAVDNGLRRLRYDCRYGKKKSKVYHYRTDLFQMRQKNLNTGTVRNIRRLATIVTQPPFATDEDSEEGTSDMDQDESDERDARTPIANAGAASVWKA